MSPGNESGRRMTRSAEEHREAGRHKEAAECFVRAADGGEGPRGDLLHRAAVSYWKAGDYVSAAAQFLSAATERRGDGDRLRESRELLGLGASYHGRGLMSKAYSVMHRSLEAAEETGDVKAIADATNWLGIICKDREDYSLAIEHHRRALELSTGAGLETEQASSLNSMGLAHHHLGQHDEAMECFGRALDIQRLADRSWGLPDTLSNMGMTLRAMGRHDEALRHYEEALDIRRRTGGRGRIANILNNMGNLHGDRGDLETAMECHRRALRIRLEISHSSGIASSLLNLADIWSHRDRPERAALCLRAALRHMEGLDTPDMRVEVVAHLTEAERRLGNVEEALELALEALELSREQHARHVERHLAEARAILETEHRVREARLLRTKNRRLQSLSDMLSEQKEQLRLILDYVPAVIVFKDSEGRIVRMNRYAAERLGLDPDEAAGMPAGEVLGALGRAPEAERGLLDGSLASWEGEEELTIGGEPRTFHVNRVPLGSGEDGFEGLVVFAVDVTEEKLAERRRLELREARERTNRLESMGYLAGRMAHDFNNLLLSISGNLELASSRSDEPVVQHNLDTAMRSARRATFLCSQLLAFSGRGSMATRRIDLSGEVGFFLSSMDSGPWAGSGILSELEPDLPPVEVDLSQLRLALENLMTLCDAGGPGPEPTLVRTGLNSVDDGDLAELPPGGEHLREGSFVFLQVGRRGFSMEDGVLESLTDPFTTGAGDDADLVVSAIQGIARSQGGFATRVEEEGTTFVRLLFPVGVRGLTGQRDEASRSRAPDGSAVLLVDDEEEVRTTASEMLDALGYRVVAVEGGKEALELLGRRREEIGCVLLDLTMPGMGGREVLSEVCRLYPDLCVVLSSGFSEDSISESEDLPCYGGFLKKPYSMAQLREALRDTMGDGAGGD